MDDAESTPTVLDDVLRSVKCIEARGDSQKWKDAMDSELKSLEKNHTWRYVERNCNQKLLKSRWVFAVKRDGLGNIKKHKARLLVKGYLQTFGVVYNETFDFINCK